MSKRTGPALALALVVAAWSSAQAVAQSSDPRPAAKTTSQLVSISDVAWGPLNPARGDQSPRAGTLWGDRTGSGPSGFLVEFADGFSSPPHIHNVTYRGIVIRGLVHNDDPDAEKMWMPAGSFWTQPAGAVHITAAAAYSNLAYIEIEDGPYLVRAAEEAFDQGERPINVDPSNMVWLDASSITWIDHSGIPAAADGPEIAFLWGRPQDGQLSGTLVKLPAGFTGKLRSHDPSFRAVVIQGRPEYRLPGATEAETLEPGSYFGAKGETEHQIACAATKACVIYVRMKDKVDVVPAYSPNLERSRRDRGPLR